MKTFKPTARVATALCALAGASLIAAGCGSDDSGETTVASGGDLPEVKD